MRQDRIKCGDKGKMVQKNVPTGQRQRKKINNSQVVR